MSDEKFNQLKDSVKETVKIVSKAKVNFKHYFEISGTVAIQSDDEHFIIQLHDSEGDIQELLQARAEAKKLEISKAIASHAKSAQRPRMPPPPPHAFLNRPGFQVPGSFHHNGRMMRPNMPQQSIRPYPRGMPPARRGSRRGARATATVPRPPIKLEPQPQSEATELVPINAKIKKEPPEYSEAVRTENEEENQHCENERPRTPDHINESSPIPARRKLEYNSNESDDTDITLTGSPGVATETFAKNFSNDEIVNGQTLEQKVQGNQSPNLTFPSHLPEGLIKDVNLPIPPSDDELQESSAEEEDNSEGDITWSPSSSEGRKRKITPSENCQRKTRKKTGMLKTRFSSAEENSDHDL